MTIVARTLAPRALPTIVAMNHPLARKLKQPGKQEKGGAPQQHPKKAIKGQGERANARYPALYTTETPIF
jgi:hypothetical protein